MHVSQLLMLWNAWLFAVRPQLRPFHSRSWGQENPSMEVVGSLRAGLPPVGCTYDVHYKNLLLKKKY